MSNQYFNFYYDPVRQGYDSNTWNTISTGVPTVVNGQLRLLNESISHFADILRGDATFSINIATPGAGVVMFFGFSGIGQTSGLGFTITDDVLTADSFNGTSTNSIPIDWNTDWSNTNTEFQIRWQAGKADFLINGNLMTSISDISVPNTPLNLYLSDNNTNELLLNYINVKGVQNLI